MKKLLSAAAALALLAQPAITFAKDREPVKISGPANAKGVTSVAIGAFNVGFIFESIDQTAASGGLMGAFGGTTKAKSELVGVTPEMMQAITMRRSPRPSRRTCRSTSTSRSKRAARERRPISSRPRCRRC
jgi:hypothetical protein